MEKIQERALRFIYDDYNSSYQNLLEKSKLPSLKIRRLKTIAIETFKIIHKNSQSYLHDLINIKLQNYNFRSQETAVLPRVRTTRYGLKSFRYSVAQIQNELSNHCRRETSLGQFNNLIQTWDPMNSSCQCNACIQCFVTYAFYYFSCHFQLKYGAVLNILLFLLQCLQTFYYYFVLFCMYYNCYFCVCLSKTLIYKLHFLLCLVLSYHALYVLFCHAFLGSILTRIYINP